MRSLPALIVALVLATPTGAVALVGANASPGARPPDGLTILRSAGAVCATGTANTKVWWSELGAQAVQGSDGSCTSVPLVAEESIAAVERGRTALRMIGYPAVVGDPVPALRVPGAYRTLTRMRPATRAATLRAMTRLRRGRLLSGFSSGQRRLVLRGLPSALQRTLRRDLAAAQRGRPQDFVGGDRRIDLVLHATPVFLGTSDGVTRCRWNSALRGSARFVGTSMSVLTDGARANLSTIAHELFHVLQCNLGADETPSDLLMEGTAEWGAGRLEPLAFAGSGTTDGAGVSIRGGAVEAAELCNDWSPLAGGLDSYRSWAVWGALEAQYPGTVRTMLLRAVTTRLSTPSDVIAQVGAARWQAAVLSAATSVCGQLRAPGGTTVFPDQVWDFIGWDAQGVRSVSFGETRTITVAAAGIGSGRAPLTAGTETVTITSTALDPVTLAGRLVLTSGRGQPVAATVDAAGVTVPTAGLTGPLRITLANPSTAVPVSVTVAVG